MSDTHQAEGEYHDAMVTVLETLWGEGFLAPGRDTQVRQTLAGIDVAGKTVLDVGSGLGGGDIVIVRDMGAERVIGLDLEQPLIDKARAYVARAGLADRIDLRMGDPDGLPVADASVDIVYSSGAFTQIEAKAHMFAEAFRVLKPGGWLAVYDWTRDQDGPFSPEMQEFFRLEGLTYAMRPLAAHRDLLAGVGFIDIHLEDVSHVYPPVCREELARLRGPLYHDVEARIGATARDHFIANWQAMLLVMERGEMRQGIYRARKPA